MRARERVTLSSALIFLVAVAASLGSSTAAEYKMSTPTPPGIASPDKVETRLGTLKFFDGFPDKPHRREALRQPRLPARRAGLPPGAAAGEPGGESQRDPRVGAGKHDRADLRATDGLAVDFPDGE